MCIRLSFQYAKTTQLLNYFARKNGGTIDKLRAMKMVFYADRYHVRQYGRPITNDDYFAMGLGPVPSGAKDIANLNAEYLDPVELEYAVRFLSRGTNDNIVRSLAAVDESILSESDLEAMRIAWESCCGIDDIVAFTHRFPEWSRHELMLKSGLSKRCPMDYLDFLADPPADIAEPCPLNERRRQALAGNLRDIAAMEAMWN